MKQKKITACSIIVKFSWGSIWWSLYDASSKYNTLWSTTNIDYYFWQVCKAKYSCNLSSSGTSISSLVSFTMDFFTSGSDMDLSLSLGHTGDALWTSSWRKDLCCWTSTEGYCACSEICVLEKWNRMWYFNWKQRWNLKIRAHSHLVGGCLYLPSLWKLNTARRCLYMLFKDFPTKFPLQYMSETIHIL